MSSPRTSLRRLGDVCRVQKGTSITEKEARPGPIPVVAGGMRPTYYHNAHNRNAGVVTVSASGANAGYVNYWTTPIWASDCTTVEASSPEHVSDSYVFHFLKSIEATTIASLRRGAAQPHVYAKDIQEIEMPMPPIEEQRRIASILDAADALRTKRRRALENLDTLAQSIFIDMFGHPCAPSAYDRIAIESVASVVTGNTPSRSQSANFGTEVEWIKSDNIQHSGAVTEAAEGLSSLGRRRARLAPKGASLVVCIAGSPDSIGRVGILDREVAFNQQINAVIPSAALVPEFLFEQLRVGKQLVQRASTNSMKGMVSKSALCAVEIVVPPLPEQEEFRIRSLRCTEMAREMRRSLDRHEALMRSLQHRAFRGEL